MTDAAEVVIEPPQTAVADSEAEIVTDADVVAIQNGVREAAAAEGINLGESSLYYDASTMASLNAFSAVRIYSIFCFWRF